MKSCSCSIRRRFSHPTPIPHECKNRSAPGVRLPSQVQQRVCSHARWNSFSKRRPFWDLFLSTEEPFWIRLSRRLVCCGSVVDEPCIVSSISFPEGLRDVLLSIDRKALSLSKGKEEPVDPKKKQGRNRGSKDVTPLWHAGPLGSLWAGPDRCPPSYRYVSEIEGGFYVECDRDLAPPGRSRRGHRIPGGIVGVKRSSERHKEHVEMDVSRFGREEKRVRALLDASRAQLRAGRPEMALRCLMEAIHCLGREGSIATWELQARQRITARSGRFEVGLSDRIDSMDCEESTSGAEEELVNLMASCLVFEQAGRPDSWGRQEEFSPQSILEESGRGVIQDDAIGDGSSYYCNRCGALVCARRALMHEQLWCSGLQNHQE